MAGLTTWLLACSSSDAPDEETHEAAAVEVPAEVAPPDLRTTIVTTALRGHPNVRVESARWETPFTRSGEAAPRLVHVVAHDGDDTVDAWLDADSHPVWPLSRATTQLRRSAITAWHGRVVQHAGRWLWCPTSRDACAVLPDAQSINGSSTDSPDECWAVVEVGGTRSESWALTWEESGPTLQRVERYPAREEVGPTPHAERIQGRATSLTTAAIPSAVRALDALMRQAPCAIDLTTLERGEAKVRAISCRIDEGGGYGVTIPGLLYDVQVGETHFQTPQHRASSGYELDALFATSPTLIVQTSSSDGSSPSGASQSDLVALSATHLHSFARRASGTEGLGNEVALASRALHVAASPEGLHVEGCESYTGVHQRAADRWVRGHREREALDIAVHFDAEHGFTVAAEDEARLQAACSVSDAL